MKDSNTDKFLKITLILAANEKDPLRKKEPFMPLSLPILASVAPQHKYKLIDMMWDSHKIDFDDDSDIVGISMRQSSEKVAFYLANEFKKRGKTVVFGGAQPSAAPYSVSKHADTIVIGEAEELWPILIQDYQKGELKKFYVCAEEPFDPKGESSFQQRKFPDLSKFPAPLRHLYKRKYTFDVVFASRGCPIACDFCMVSDIFGKQTRLKPVDQVVNEITQFKGFYYLLDDTVFGRPDCYDYYIELYTRLAELPGPKYWTGQANLDAAATEKGRLVIKKAAKAGLVYAAIGIESINTSTLKSSGSINKMGINNIDEALNKMKDHISYIQDQGIIISGWFTIGYEHDNKQTYFDTIKFCEETNILPAITPVRALTGSRLHEKLEKEKKIQEFGNNVSNIKHETLKNDDVRTAMKITTKKGYNFHRNCIRLKFYYKKIRNNKQSFNDIVYRTIFAYMTQRKMQKIIRKETKNF